MKTTSKFESVDALAQAIQGSFDSHAREVAVMRGLTHVTPSQWWLETFNPKMMAWLLWGWESSQPNPLSQEDQTKFVRINHGVLTQIKFCDGSTFLSHLPELATEFLATLGHYLEGSATLEEVAAVRKLWRGNTGTTHEGRAAMHALTNIVLPRPRHTFVDKFVEFVDACCVAQAWLDRLREYDRLREEARAKGEVFRGFLPELDLDTEWKQTVEQRSLIANCIRQEFPTLPEVRIL